MSVEVGDVIPAWTMESVSAEKMKTMAAILRDPNPVHWDQQAVADLPLGLGHRTINQGPLGLSYIFNMLHTWQSPGCVKRIHMTFPQVVLDGDRVTSKGIITAIGDDGIECEVWLERAGERLLEGTALVGH